MNILNNIWIAISTPNEALVKIFCVLFLFNFKKAGCMYEKILFKNFMSFELSKLPSSFFVNITK